MEKFHRRHQADHRPADRQRNPRGAAGAAGAVQGPAAADAAAPASAAGGGTTGRPAAAGDILARRQNEGRAARGRTVRLRLRARCHVPGAAVSGYARRRRAAGLGPCASHGGGIGAGDAEAVAEAGPAAGLR